MNGAPLFFCYPGKNLFPSNGHGDDRAAEQYKTLIEFATGRSLRSLQNGGAWRTEEADSLVVSDSRDIIKSGFGISRLKSQAHRYSHQDQVLCTCRLLSDTHIIFSST